MNLSEEQAHVACTAKNRMKQIINVCLDEGRGLRDGTKRY